MDRTLACEAENLGSTPNGRTFMEVQFFDKNLEQFISDLDEAMIAKVLRTIDLLEKFGSQLEMPHSKSLGQGLFELRVHGQREIRILYIFRNNKAILLHGLIKKTERLSSRELLSVRNKIHTLDII